MLMNPLTVAMQSLTTPLTATTHLTAAPPGPSGPQGVQVVIPPLYKSIVWAVLLLTVASFAVAIAMVIFIAPLSADQHTVLEGANTVWKMGAGAFIGLLGGKSMT
jgi:hypothetical protein